MVYEFDIELTPDLELTLPPTDTRFRPDQRMYENGFFEDAELEKQRVEQNQRARRKEMEAAGVKWKPQWFRSVKDACSSSGQSWQYDGNYWESRGAFKGVSEIF